MNSDLAWPNALYKWAVQLCGLNSEALGRVAIWENVATVLQSAKLLVARGVLDLRIFGKAVSRASRPRIELPMFERTTHIV